MIDIENLLAPISAESPCGADMDGDPAVAVLESHARGKEAKYASDKDNKDRLLSEAIPPNWGKTITVSIELLAATKDLRIAKYLVAALAHTEGLQGFAKGVGLLREWLEKYWTSLHPLLDDPNDDWRSRLVVEINDDPLGALDGLREAPLAASRKLGQFRIGDIEVADGSMPPKPDRIVPSFEMLRDAIRDSDPALIEALVTAKNNALRDLAAIQSVFRDQQTDICPEFPVVEKLLTRLGKLLADAAGAEEGEVAGDQAGSGAAGDLESDSSLPEAGSASGIGRLRSRADARRLLETVCEFLEKTEPAHPAPLLIRRGARLLDMSFVEIIRDLTPEAVGQIESLGGLNRE